jgi:Golgi nucleoside diphosphatase
MGSTTVQSSRSQELHYAIVLDAGSSGTRAYLYSWPEHSGDKHELLKISPLLQDGEPMVKKATPGLSSMGETPDNAYEYLRPLLSFASDNIPLHKHKETPLYILATAGMRLLEKEKQEAVLANLRKGIQENFSFYFPEGHLEIISGKQEGIYQWLAINYVLGKFQHAEHLGNDEELVAVEASGHRDAEGLVFRPRTVGALDMGGASMQVALEITTELQLAVMTDMDKSQVADINLG